MAATPSPPSSLSLCRRCPAPSLNLLNPMMLTAPELSLCFRFPPNKTSFCASLSPRVRALKPESDRNPNLVSAFQEDGNYLWKLSFGSVMGAAIIKYGCVVFPGITTPNIVQALLMISAPMVAALILLFFGSRQE